MKFASVPEIEIVDGTFATGPAPVLSDNFT